MLSDLPVPYRLTPVPPPASHPEEPAMTPQHTGATPTDLTTWDAADFETSQVFAVTGQQAAATPGTPIPPSNPPDTDGHQLAA